MIRKTDSPKNTQKWRVKRVDVPTATSTPVSTATAKPTATAVPTTVPTKVPVTEKPVQTPSETSKPQITEKPIATMEPVATKGPVLPANTPVADQTVMQSSLKKVTLVEQSEKDTYKVYTNKNVKLKIKTNGTNLKYRVVEKGKKAGTLWYSDLVSFVCWSQSHTFSFCIRN